MEERLSPRQEERKTRSKLSSSRAQSPSSSHLPSCSALPSSPLLPHSSKVAGVPAGLVSPLLPPDSSGGLNKSKKCSYELCFCDWQQGKQQQHQVLVRQQLQCWLPCWQQWHQRRQNQLWKKRRHEPASLPCVLASSILIVLLAVCCNPTFSSAPAADLNSRSSSSNTISKRSDLPRCSHQGQGFVRNISAAPLWDYGRAGLSHVSVASAVHHGNTQVEVWLQNFARGTYTPIHRHACEEVFLVLKGRGCVRFGSIFKEASDAGGAAVGRRASEGMTLAAEELSAGSVLIVPPNQVHQIANTDSEAPLQLLVFISSPPIRIYRYASWDSRHGDADLIFPYFWDRDCPE